MGRHRCFITSVLSLVTNDRLNNTHLGLIFGLVMVRGFLLYRVNVVYLSNISNLRYPVKVI
jgi:hypothetical protein